MGHHLDRYIPMNINQKAISRKKGIKIDHNIDLFNNDIKLKDDLNMFKFEGKIMALNKDTLIDQIILKNKQNVDSYHQFIQTNLKNHGQKNWINLKKNFITQAFITDTMSVLQSERVFKYNDSKKSKAKRLKFSKILITNHKKTTENIPNMEPFRVLEAPELKNDFYSNPLSWSNTNILAVGLDKSVYIWDPQNFQTKTLLESEYLDEQDDTITSLSFCPSKRCDFLACGTKLGRLILLKASNINNESPFNSIILHTINNNENVLYDTRIGNKGICSLKWYLNPPKEFDKGNDIEEWILFCGNEIGEVSIFQLIEDSLTRKSSYFSNNSLKSSNNEFNSINISKSRTKSNTEIDDLIDDFDTTDLSIETSHSSQRNDDLARNHDYQNLFLKPLQQKQRAVDTFKNNLVNVFTSPNSGTPRKIKIESNLYVTTTKYYSLKCLNTIKPQTQQLCGMDISTIHDKHGKILESQLSVGGNDNSCTVWNITNIDKPEYLYNLPHTAAVKGVLFCPWLDYILATGGGSKDRYIRIWNTKTGTLIKKIKTAGQITSLIWSRHKHELMLTFGFGNPEQPVLLKTFEYPTMRLKSQIKTSDQSRVLCSALSPNFDVLVLATNDETLKFFSLMDSSPNPTIKRSEFIDAYNNHQMNNKFGVNQLPKRFYI
ncbi:uncharacterized protein HGUI_02653 [Hanseniaspora guilliermondii]|uniref:Meiosis-specific APC/C activator protein AMA1 n=1 Tax=Hanseniaspora guilliermondii TaxID=56406 RepID=A0A1L0CNI2_9ASCO|nr:uncharacterized protein HGUI_02653 [Hanseniaspora guilliermondii]